MFADLTVAVEVGMLLAALLFIHRVAATTTVASVTDDMLGDGEPRVLTDSYIPAYCSVIRIRGPFLFGATQKLEHATADVSKFGPVVVLKMTYMSAIDGTGIHALESLAKRLAESGRTLVLCGAPTQPAAMIERSKLVHILGRRNLQPHLDAALERAVIISRRIRRAAGKSPRNLKAKRPLPSNCRCPFEASALGYDDRGEPNSGPAVLTFAGCSSAWLEQSPRRQVARSNVWRRCPRTVL